MDKEQFGKFFQELRISKKLTQEGLAEKLNISSKTISKWECGKALPDIEMLAQIAEFFNISLYELKTCKKIDNRLVSKKDIKKVINITTLKKIIAKRLCIAIILLFFASASIITTIYTIKNYNRVHVYELTSEDENYDIKGLFISSNKRTMISINYLSPCRENTELFNASTNYVALKLLTQNGETLASKVITNNNKLSLLNVLNKGYINFVYNKIRDGKKEYFTLIVTFIENNNKKEIAIKIRLTDVINT